MNNCYGKSGNMQMPLVKIYPDFGDVFYIKCCVEDTDDTDMLEDEVCMWLEDNVYNVENFEIVYGYQQCPGQLHLVFVSDIDGNEFEVFTPENFVEKEDGNDLIDWVTDYFGTTKYDVV